MRRGVSCGGALSMLVAGWRTWLRWGGSALAAHYHQRISTSRVDLGLVTPTLTKNSHSEQPHKKCLRQELSSARNGFIQRHTARTAVTPAHSAAISKFRHSQPLHTSAPKQQPSWPMSLAHNHALTQPPWRPRSPAQQLEVWLGEALSPPTLSPYPLTTSIPRLRAKALIAYTCSAYSRCHGVQRWARAGGGTARCTELQIMTPSFGLVSLPGNQGGSSRLALIRCAHRSHLTTHHHSTPANPSSSELSA